MYMYRIDHEKGYTVSRVKTEDLLNKQALY